MTKAKLTSMPLVCGQETAVIVSSDSDSSFSDSEEVVYGDSDEVLKESSMEEPVPLQDALEGLVAMSSHEAETSTPSKESDDCGAVVEPAGDGQKSNSYDKLNSMEESVDCLNCVGDVMSLCDLEQYGVTLEGLISELSEMSDKLVRCGW